jgi:hypothetical protein
MHRVLFTNTTPGSTRAYRSRLDKWGVHKYSNRKRNGTIAQVADEGLDDAVSPNSFQTPADDVEESPAFTDSGYASRARFQKVPLPCLNQQDNDTDDSERTDYSAATSTAPILRQTSVQEFCHDLHSRVSGLRDVQNWPLLSKAIKALVQAFALKVGQEGSPECLRIMRFVHQHSG